MFLSPSGHAILYKYYSWDTWSKYVSKSKTIRFTNPHYFNDPFELSAGCHPLSNVDLMGVDRECNIDRNIVVLCLTRNPLNSLMWAHYGDSHRGVVVGFDVVSMGLGDKDRCVLPYQFGNVIYTSTKPQGFYADSFNEEIYSFCNYDPLFLEALQRNYLYKSYEWAYEEEVRIVRHRRSFLSEVSSSEVHCVDMSFNLGSVREIYFGWRFLMGKKPPRSTCLRAVKATKRDFPSARLSFVEPVGGTWKLQAHHLGDDWQEFIQGYFDF